MSLEHGIDLQKEILKDYQNFIDQLGEINGMINHSKSIFSCYETYINNQDRSIDSFLLQSKFAYHSPTRQRLVNTETSVYEVNMKNFAERLGIIIRKTNNFYSTQSYELFETFLRSVTAKFIVLNNDKALDFDEKLGFNNINSCKLFLQSQYKDNIILFKILRHLIPEFDEAFRKNKELENYFNFYRAYTIVRHSITHTNDIISIRKLKNIGAKEREVLLSIFLVSEQNNIVDTSETSTQILDKIGELGYLIMNSFGMSFKYY